MLAQTITAAAKEGVRITFQVQGSDLLIHCSNAKESRQRTVPLAEREKPGFEQVFHVILCNTIEDLLGRPF